MDSITKSTESQTWHGPRLVLGNSEGSSSPLPEAPEVLVTSTSALRGTIGSENMEMQSYARMRENQLSDEILGLDERIAEVEDGSNSEQRCVSLCLKQLVKSKRAQLATRRQQNS